MFSLCVFTILGYITAIAQANPLDKRGLDVCVTYTIIESTILFETCVPTNQVITLGPGTGITVTNAPTCLTTTVTTTTTLTEQPSGQTISSQIISSSTPTARNSISTTPQPTSSCAIIPAPAPTVAGTTDKCCQWYIASANSSTGTTCASIEAHFKTPSASFYALNPTVDCRLASAISLGSAYCVQGIPASIPIATTARISTLLTSVTRTLSNSSTLSTDTSTASTDTSSPSSTDTSSSSSPSSTDTTLLLTGPVKKVSKKEEPIEEPETYDIGFDLFD